MILSSSKIVRSLWFNLFYKQHEEECCPQCWPSPHQTLPPGSDQSQFSYDAIHNWPGNLIDWQLSKLSSVMSAHLQEQVCAVRGGVGSGEVKRSLLEGVAGSTSASFIKSNLKYASFHIVHSLIINRGKDWWSCMFYVGKIKKRQYIIQCSRFSITIPERTAGAFISNAAVGILKQVPVEETNSQNRV